MFVFVMVAATFIPPPSRIYWQNRRLQTDIFHIWNLKSVTRIINNIIRIGKIEHIAILISVFSLNRLECITRRETHKVPTSLHCNFAIWTFVTNMKNTTYTTQRVNKNWNQCKRVLLTSLQYQFKITIANVHQSKFINNTACFSECFTIFQDWTSDILSVEVP